MKKLSAAEFDVIQARIENALLRLHGKPVAEKTAAAAEQVAA